MIECKDILNLCDRFEQFLTPIDIYILRQRYNGDVFKSTYAVASDMGISDETVRTIENRALDALAYCLDLEAAGQTIIPMRLAYAFKQPVANLLAQGLWRSVSCGNPTNHRGEVIIYAPRLAMETSEFEMHVKQRQADITLMTAYPRGALIGRALLVKCFKLPVPIRHAHQWIMMFEQPELFAKPLPYTGCATFFYVETSAAQKLPPRYVYSF